MTDLANTDLKISARQTQGGVSIARGHLRTLRMDIQANLYGLAESTVNSSEFQGLRADLNADLAALDGIYSRLERLVHLLERDTDAEFTFAQAQVRDMLDSIAAAGVIDRLQADYFVSQAVEAFKPSRVDTTAVEQRLFALVSDPNQRRLRGGVTIDKVRQTLQEATQVSH